MWIIKSGVENHMCRNEKDLWKSESYVVNGIKMIKGFLICGRNNDCVPIENVIVMPNLNENVLSLDILINKGFEIKFVMNNCEIFRKNIMIIRATRIDYRYVIETAETEKGEEIITLSYQEQEKVEETEKRKEMLTLSHQEKEMFEGDDRLECITAEPTEWKEIELLEDQEKLIWNEAMDAEIKCLQDNHVLEDYDKVPQDKVIGSRWVFSVKYDERGRKSKVRARLVALGCHQREGIDYGETFAPVVAHTTIRVLLTIAGARNLMIRHCDISSAFLYGQLDEHIIMRGPVSQNPQKLYKLKKAIYGLKQAAHCWNLRIDESLRKIGYMNNKNEPCLYIKKLNDLVTYILIHVDDLLLVGNDDREINDTINALSKEYTLKDLGSVKKYLGICINRDMEKQFIYLHQSPMIDRLVKKYGLNDCAPVRTPMATDFVKNQDSNESPLLPNNLLYQAAVGALLYIGLVSRPDIHLSVNILSRRTANPHQSDWEGIKRVIKYLKHTSSYSLKLGGTCDLVLNAYSDADWGGGDMNTRKSTSGQTVFLGDSLIDWKARRQNCVSLSTAEAELIATVETAQTLCWVKDLVNVLGVITMLPIIIYSDNQSSIHILESPKGTKRSKHIDVKQFFVRDLIAQNIIKLEYCPTDVMKADLMTKPLARVLHIKLLDSIGMNIISDEKTESHM